MIRYFQTRFALSEKGARSFCQAILYSTLLNIVLMLPAVYMFRFLMDYLSDEEQPHGFWFYVSMALAFMLVIFVVARLQYNSTYTKIYTESANRRIGVAEKLRKLPLAFFGEKNLSDLTSTIMEDCSQLEQIFSHTVPQLFASVLSMLFIATGLFFYNWQLALALFWVVPLAAAVILFSRKQMNKFFKKHYYIKRDVTEQIQEGLECIQEIKAYNGEDDFRQSFDETLERHENYLIRHELLLGVLINLSHALLKFGFATVIVVGAGMLTQGTLSTFDYLIFLLVASAVYNPIQEVFNNMAILMFLDVRINRLKEMESMPIQTGNTDEQITHYDIAFHNVSFAYEENRQVLKEVSFVARQGEVTALVGPSGGGKSTTAKLAARFWDITDGEITLGGKDISKIDPEALLKHYAVVFQDVMLFNCSIADNIRIGKRNATDEEIRRVARLAQCDEFVQKMPQGYDTVIGENGMTLSGGERQRISIARALLKDASVILLDEATASLDAENETKIQSGISELVKNKTVIVIAHRMRTILNADKIVVLKNGMVAECGTPYELLQKGGEFARMVELQQT